jgi:6-pyruvoyltetrahydropterin/6-carboxytetrahydropterin synthase
MELRTSITIAMAHRLQDFNGPCRNLHGHNWVITSTCRIDPDDVNVKAGFVVEFGTLRKVIKNALDSFDHSTVLETGDFFLPHLRFDGSRVHELNVPPTTEHLASLFYEVIAESLYVEFGLKVGLGYIELQETPNNTVFATSHSTGVELV